MGRPINKRYLGVTGSGTTVSDGLTNEARLTATVKVGTESVSATGIVLAQRSETKFKVNDAADGSGTTGVCVLVDKDTPLANEMVILGYVDGEGSGVKIRKMHNRTCFDFDNNRYSWVITDTTTSTGAPSLPGVVKTEGVDGVSTESNVVTFAAISNGQSVTVAGVTVTADDDKTITAVQLATAFSSAGTVPANGTMSGTLTDWTVSARDGVTVTYTSTTEDENVTDLEDGISTADTSVSNKLVLTSI